MKRNDGDAGKHTQTQGNHE